MVCVIGTVIAGLEDDLHAYIDGRLDETRRTEVTAYLEKHPDVDRRFALYSGQRGMLRSALDKFVGACSRLAEFMRSQSFLHLSPWQTLFRQLF